MLLRAKPQPKSALGLGLLLALACAAVLLLGHLDEERVVLPQAGIDEAVLQERSGLGYRKQLGQHLAHSLDLDDEALAEEVLSELHIGSRGDEHPMQPTAVDLQVPSEQAVSSLVKAAGDSSSGDVSSLLKKAADIDHQSQKKARQAEAKEHDVEDKIARRKEELKDLERKIAEHKEALKHTRTASKHLTSALRRVREGGDVAGILQRAREYADGEEDELNDHEDWLQSAQEKAAAAIDLHKSEIALHQAKLRKLRYFLNRMQVEQYAKNAGYVGGPEYEGLRGHLNVQDFNQDADAAVYRQRDYREGGYRQGGYGHGRMAAMSNYRQDGYRQGDDGRGRMTGTILAARDPPLTPKEYPWSYAAISGGAAVPLPHPAQTMHAIENAMRVVDNVEPRQTAEDKARIRSKIEAAVHRSVDHEATRLQTAGLTTQEEEDRLQEAIQKAVVKAVAKAVAEKAKASKKDPNPNYGRKYVEDMATKAAQETFIAARAMGKSDTEIRVSATQAAQRASEVAIRQVSQSAARAAALRAAQIASDAGQDAASQKVAAQVAARAAVRRIVQDDSALRYLNQQSPGVVPSDRSSTADALSLAARNVQQAADATLAGAQGFPSRGEAYGGQLAVPQPLLLSVEQPPSVSQAVAANSASKVGEAAVAEDPELAHIEKEAQQVEGALGTASGNGTSAQSDVAPKVDPQAQQVMLKAAEIRAEAAVKKAKAAAQAAALAPPGEEGAKIIAQSKLIAAEAARDVADARMKAELVRNGQGPQPIINEAAAAAVKLVTPIATEIASQNAALKATVEAVAAAKKLIHDRNEAAANAAAAANHVVSAAESSLKDVVRTSITASISKAVEKAVANTNGQGMAAMIGAARQAALLEADQMEDSLQKEIKQDSIKTAEEAAAAAKAAGGNGQEVDNLRSQALNTMRLDGDEAIRESREEAEQVALNASLAAREAAQNSTAVTRAQDKSVAKAAVEDAVKSLSEGGEINPEAVVQAEQALKHEQDLKAQDSGDGDGATEQGDATVEQGDVAADHQVLMEPDPNPDLDLPPLPMKKGQTTQSKAQLELPKVNDHAVDDDFDGIVDKEVQKLLGFANTNDNIPL